MVTLGYSTDIANKEASRAMQKSLDNDADELMKKLDVLIAK